MTTDLPLPLLGLFTRNWWAMLVKGILAVLFSIVAFRSPAVTLALLVLAFGVYALLDGLFSLAVAITGWSHRENRWLLLLEGLIGIGAGIVTLRATALTAVALAIFIAAWALSTGVLKIITAIRLRKEISNELWLGLSGAASVIFAFLVMLNPLAGAIAIVWLIAWYALIMGGLLIVLSFQLRGLRNPDSRPGATEHPTRRAA